MSSAPKPLNSAPEVFFLIGVPRSGTTLLQLMLDHHPEIGMCPESNFMENILRYGAMEQFRTGWHFREFVFGISHWLAKFNDPAHELVQAMLRQHPDYSGPTKPLLQQWVQDYLAVKQKRIFGEKTPENAHFLRPLRAFCPAAKIVVLLRHPLDTVCSLSKSVARVKGIANPYSDANLLHTALFVKRGLQAILRNTSGHDPQVFTLTYEALVQDPGPTLSGLCSFLGVNYEPQMLQFATPGFFTGKDPRSVDLHTGLSQPLNSANKGQYARLLSSGQSALLCRFLASEMAQLPYPTTPGTLTFAQNLLLGVFRLLYALKQPHWREVWIMVKIRVKELLVPFRSQRAESAFR